MNTRVVVMKLMPAVVKILKDRFPNLGAEEVVLIAGRICDEVVRVSAEDE